MKLKLTHFLIALSITPSACPLTVSSQEIPPVVRSVQRIPAGVVVNEVGSSRWNQVVMIAKPRISSGQTDAVPHFARQAVSKFVLTILATVGEQLDYPLPETANKSRDTDRLSLPRSESPGTTMPTKRYRLEEVGVGHSVQVGDQLVLVRPDESAGPGVQLSFFERQILAENQRSFEEIRTVVRTPHLLMFDVPSLLLHNGTHQDFLMRHLVWVDSASGNTSVLLWLLDVQQPNGPVQDSLQVVKTVPICKWDSRQMEDRAIHVDKNEFTLGIPGKRAFALEGMPAGKSVDWNEKASELAGLTQYNRASLHSLMVALFAACEKSQTAVPAR